MPKTKDFAKFIANQIAADADLADEVDRERLNGEVADIIYNERIAAGLTQAQLADKAGTHQSVIARLEDADYNGRTIELLRSVLRAMGCRLALSAEPLMADTAIVDIIPFHGPRIWKPEPGSKPIEKQTISSAQ